MAWLTGGIREPMAPPITRTAQTCVAFIPSCTRDGIIRTPTMAMDGLPPPKRAPERTSVKMMQVDKILGREPNFAFRLRKTEYQCRDTGCGQSCVDIPPDHRNLIAEQNHKQQAYRYNNSYHIVFPPPRSLVHLIHLFCVLKEQLIGDNIRLLCSD